MSRLKLAGFNVGGLKILPKKRWHVRTYENIKRVKKDEAKAAEEEKVRLERAALAEQEARTSFLRQKAADRRAESGVELRPNEDDFDTAPGPSQKLEHVNFFTELEEQERTYGANKEAEKEKKQEREKEEKKLGILTYLGQGSEKGAEVAWWQKLPERFVADKKPPVVSTAPERLPVPQRVVSAAPMQTRPEKSSKKHHKKHKKHKHKKRVRRSSSSSSDSVVSSKGEESQVSQTTSNSSLEALREERLKREMQERAKTEQLLRRLRGEKEPDAAPSKMPNFKQKYNSQFNPEYCRQNKMD